MHPVAVSDTIRVPTQDYLREDGEDWQSYVVSVPVEWLDGQFWQYEDKLFSANVRGYLGLTRHIGNINSGIRNTLHDEPGNFWIYNNGVTALTNSVEVAPETGELIVSGLAIVNGAQTTGALSNSDNTAAKDRARIMVRFITCTNPSVVHGIVRFTNRQNPTRASDFCSNDSVQRRLVEEFEELGVEGYTGGRRGDIKDVIRRQPDGSITTDSAAQALVAFHGEPHIAYHNKNAIWESNDLYRRFFNPDTSAQHMLFCWSLLKAVERKKQELREISEDLRTTSKQEALTLLEQRGSLLLFVAAIGHCVEDILDRRVPSSFRLSFMNETSTEAFVELWRPILDRLLPIAKDHLVGPLYAAGGLRSTEVIEQAFRSFRGHVDSAISNDRSVCDEFAKHVHMGRR